MIRLTRLAAGFLISFGLLAWAFARADVGKVRDVLAAADGPLVLAAFGILLASHVVHSYRWVILISALGGSVRFSRLVAVHFLGLLYNSLLPAQLGVETARIQFGEMLVGSRSRMLVLALADRLIGVVTLALVAGAACLILGMHDSRVWPLAAAPAIVLGGAAVLVLAARLRPAPMERWLRAVGGRSRLGTWILSLVTTAGRLAERPRHLASVAATAGIQLAICSMSLGVLSKALGLHAPVVLVGLACSLIGLVTMIVPISINGIGVREAMFCATTIPLGLDQSQALALSFAWFALGVATAAPGILGWMVLASHREGTDPHPARSPAPPEGGASFMAEADEGAAFGSREDAGRLVECVRCPESVDQGPQLC